MFFLERLVIRVEGGFGWMFDLEVLVFIKYTSIKYRFLNFVGFRFGGIDLVN